MRPPQFQKRAPNTVLRHTTSLITHSKEILVCKIRI